jgi:hypothetical protein
MRAQATRDTVTDIMNWADKAGGAFPEQWWLPEALYEEIFEDIWLATAPSIRRGPHGGPYLAGVELRCVETPE